MKHFSRRTGGWFPAQSNTLVKILVGVLGAVILAGVLAAVATAIAVTAMKARTEKTAVTSEKMTLRIKEISKRFVFLLIATSDP